MKLSFCCLLLAWFSISVSAQNKDAIPTEVEEVYKVVDQMPRFPGCEDIEGSTKDKEACAKGKMLDYIYKNLEYPEIAKKKGIEGMTVIQFIVEKNGAISNAKIVRDLEGGCGESALKTVEKMNNLLARWTPGSQRGKKVKVQDTLPIRFKIHD